MAPTATTIGRRFLHAGHGIWSWLLTTSHERIAILYLVTVSIFFLLGSILGGVLRLESLTPEGDLLQAETFDRLFTLHGLTLVFFFLLPTLSAVLGNLLLPPMIGASNVAFPRLNLLGYYLFLGGGVLLAVSTIRGAVDTGWTLMLPFSSRFSHSEVTSALVGVLLAGTSAGLMGLNLVVTTHLRRAPGVSWSQLPVFVWAQYANGLVLALSTPLLIAALSVLSIDLLDARGRLPSGVGGNVTLYRTLFWAWAHPALHAPLLSALGIASHLLATFSNRTLQARRAVVISILAIAVFGSLSFGQHLYPEGQGLYFRTLTSLFALLVGVPCTVLLAHWIAMLNQGTLRFTAPMLYALAFIGIFTIGGVSGLYLAALPLGVHFQGTAFQVAHFHYFVAGGVLTAFLGGLHFWWPRVTGRLYPELMARFVAVVVFFGFNTMFLPQFLLGYLGKPSRAHSYAPEFQILEVLSTGGATILVAGLAFPAVYLAWSFFWGTPASANPWKASGPEWRDPVSSDGGAVG